MARYVVINQDGIVLNVAEWDGETPWPQPNTVTVLPDDGTSAFIGLPYGEAPPTPPDA